MTSDNTTSVRDCLDTLSEQWATLLVGDFNIPGTVVIFLFYGLIFVVGILTTWLVNKKKRRGTQQVVVSLSKVEDLLLAGRDMGPVVAVLTIVATQIGGGMINGTAEVMMNPNLGLAWCQAPVFYIVAVIVSAFTIIKPMRAKNYRTLLDPVEDRFGRVQTVFSYIPHMFSDVFWSASILTALGTSLSVILGINYMWSVVISAGVVVVYTIVGGLYSVAYTDVIELVLLFIGLWLVVPFALLNPATTSIIETANWNTSWLGPAIEGPALSLYVDIALMMVIGGQCWQPLLQRTLAVRSTSRVRLITVLGGIGALVCVIPVVILGAVAFSTDWNATDYREIGAVPVPECNYPLALPMVMRFLTPMPVAVVGLGAVAAAVMSSTDSAILSSASLITLNLYSPIRKAVRKGCAAGDSELIAVMRGVIVFVGAVSTVIAVLVPKTYGLLVLAADLQYVVLSPQVMTALFIPFANTYGSIAAYWTALVLRVLSGEPLLNVPAVIHWPWEDGYTQYFPFRLCIVLISMVAFLSVSILAKYCSRKSETIRRLDERTLGCFVVNIATETNVLVELKNP